MKCIHVPRAVNPPPAVDGCCDRRQRLTGRGKAARRPPHRLLYRSLHQIGAVSQFSPTAQHTLSVHNNRRRKRGGGVSVSVTSRGTARKKEEKWDYLMK